MNAKANGRASGAGRLVVAALPAMLCAAVWAGAAWADVPDNRGVGFNPDDPVSPAYGETIQDRDKQRLDDALEHGDSFVSTVHGTGRAPHEGPPLPLEHGSDPADVGSASPEPAAKAPRPVPAYESIGRPRTRGPDRDGGLTAMIGALLESWTRPPEIVRLRYADPQERVSDAARSSAAPEPPAPADDRARLPHVAAGQGFYAHTLYAVDSDYPGPVVLELLQPPLVGAVAHGGFERVGERLVLRLASLTWRGRTHPVDAWAVDPECACFGIEGEVDRHFMARVVLPAAARFAEGFMTAAAMPARTLSLQDGTVLHERGAGERETLHSGLGAAARTLGDVLTADAPKETTVRIPRNTPLVVMVARPLATPPGAADTAWREGTDAGN